MFGGGGPIVSMGEQRTLCDLDVMICELHGGGVVIGEAAVFLTEGSSCDVRCGGCLFGALSGRLASLKTLSTFR